MWHHLTTHSRNNIIHYVLLSSRQVGIPTILIWSMSPCECSSIIYCIVIRQNQGAAFASTLTSLPHNTWWWKWSSKTNTCRLITGERSSAKLIKGISSTNATSEWECSKCVRRGTYVCRVQTSGFVHRSESVQAHRLLSLDRTSGRKETWWVETAL